MDVYITPIVREKNDGRQVMDVIKDEGTGRYYVNDPDADGARRDVEVTIPAVGDGTGRLVNEPGAGKPDPVISRLDTIIALLHNKQ